MAKPADWPTLGQTEAAAWGECKGSGKLPYQVGFDQVAGAFRCTCPSRVFPCKHGAGLALLLAREPARFTATSPPAWLAEWLGKRQEKEAAKVGRVVERAAVEAQYPASKSPEELTKAAAREAAARAKKEAQKAGRSRQAAADLETWLLDVARAGLVHAHQQPAAFWETPAARLVDGQLPGLAARIRAVPALLEEAGLAWADRLLAALGELYLLARAVQQPAALPPALQVETQLQTGLPMRRDALTATGETVTDTWYVAGTCEPEGDPRLRECRVWLWGTATRRWALVLSYAVGREPFEFAPPLESRVRGELTFYPGSLPLRAAPGTLAPAGGPWPDLDPAAEACRPPGTGVADALTAYAAALGANPWLRLWPMRLRDCRIVPDPAAPDPAHAPRWLLLDPAENLTLPLDPSYNQHLGWRNAALFGGQPVWATGEWDGHRLRVLSFSVEIGAVSEPTLAAVPTFV